MAYSTVNVEALRLGVQKVLTEIFYDGGVNNGGEIEGSSGGLKATDEAADKIITCLGNAVLEMHKEVPKEYICTLSNKIMIEPVIIASGQTYEKSHITEWLRHERTCPITKEVLSNLILTPNHVISELIAQWYRINKYDPPKPSDATVFELFTGDIESLLQRISSRTSVADQMEAAKELSRQTKKYVNARVFFVTQLPYSITRLLTPLLIMGNNVNDNTELQENIITSLFNMSTVEKNKRVIAENPHVIPLLAKSLQKGTVQTKKICAATISSLSAIDSNKILIGNSKALLQGLINLMNGNDLSATSEAAYAVFNLCREVENKEKVISAGVLYVIFKKIRAMKNRKEMVALFASISTSVRAFEEMDQTIVSHLFGILQISGSSITLENVLTIFLNMCEGFTDMSRMEPLYEEESCLGTFTRHAREGSELAKIKAERILDWIQRYVDEHKPQDAME